MEPVQKNESPVLNHTAQGLETVSVPFTLALLPLSRLVSIIFFLKLAAEPRASQSPPNRNRDLPTQRGYVITQPWGALWVRVFCRTPTRRDSRSRGVRYGRRRAERQTPPSWDVLEHKMIHRLCHTALQQEFAYYWCTNFFSFFSESILIAKWSVLIG